MLRRTPLILSSFFPTCFEHCRVWNPETRICEAVLSGHGGTIGALCTLFSRRPPVVSNTARHGREQKNGELLIISGSGDSTVRVWGRAGDGTGMREWTCRAVLKGHRYGLTAVRWSMFGEHELLSSRKPTGRAYELCWFAVYSNLTV